MIVSAEGHSHAHAESDANITMIVCTTGTAYSKRGKVAAVIRFFKRNVRQIINVFSYVCSSVKVFMATKSGKPTSIDPPLVNNM